MKKNRTTAIILAFALIFQTAASASVLGEELRTSGVELTDGVRLAKGVYWSSSYSDRLAENYIEYSPTGDVRPVVAFGDKVIGSGSFSYFASKLEAAGQHVIGGINADYFVMASTEPLGVIITDGILRSSDAGHGAIAFREDGTAFVGWPSLGMTVTLEGEEYPLETFNKRRAGGGYVLFNSDFATKTLNTVAGTDVILSLKDAEDGAPTVNYNATLIVEEVRKSSGSIDIPEGKFILSLSRDADEWRQTGVENLEPGDEIILNIACADARFIDAEYAVGSFRRILVEGEVVPGLEQTRGPRTAVGIKPDGSVILYTIDGRQSGLSIGAGMHHVAERLIELGCVEAGLMDGGGSTGLSALYIGDEAVSQINSPSDGAPRAVTNYIMLVTTAPATGVAERLGVTPHDVLMLSGAERKFTVKASDETLRPAPLPGEVTFEPAEGLGTISADGTFRAGPASMEGVLTARSGGIEGRATIKVVDTPDIITVYNEVTWNSVKQLDLKRGGSVNLYAAASQNHMSLLVQDTCYKWELSGDIGTIDEWGRFTAVDHDATGEIRVTAGGRTVTIAVTVGWDNPYRDVSGSDWFYDYVKYVTDNGLMNGTASNAFSPDTPMTRAMFVTVLGRMEGVDTAEYTKHPFSDVPKGEYYTGYVAWAAEKGIVTGVSATSFNPDGRLTREQLCVIIARYLASNGATLTPDPDAEDFADADEISDWAIGAVRACHAAGLISGRGEGIFDPKSPTSRAEVAAILMRMAGLTPDTKTPPEESEDLPVDAENPPAEPGTSPDNTENLPDSEGVLSNDPEDPSTGA